MAPVVEDVTHMLAYPSDTRGYGAAPAEEGGSNGWAGNGAWETGNGAAARRGAPVKAQASAKYAPGNGSGERRGSLGRVNTMVLLRRSTTRIFAAAPEVKSILKPASQFHGEAPQELRPKRRKRVTFATSATARKRGHEGGWKMRLFAWCETVHDTVGREWHAALVFVQIVETFLLPERLALGYGRGWDTQSVLMVCTDAFFCLDVVIHIAYLVIRRAEFLHLASMSERQRNRITSARIAKETNDLRTDGLDGDEGVKRVQNRAVQKKQRDISLAIARESESQKRAASSADELYHFLFRRFPLEVLAIAGAWIERSHPSEWYVRLLANLPRVIRIEQLLRFFRAQEMNLRVDVRQLAVIKFCLLIVGCAHWVGCIFFYLSRLSDFSGYYGKSTWVAQWEEFHAGVIDYNAESSDTWQSYLLIIYKGLNGLTNLGYERAVPQRYDEMVFSVLVIYLHVILDAYILGTLFHYVVKKDKNAELFRKKIQEVHKWSRSRGIPEEIETQMISHYEFQFSKKREDDSKVLSMLPNPIKLKVASHNYGRFIHRNKYLFKRCSQQFIENFQLRLTEEYLMPGEVFAREKDMAREFVFLATGTLEFHREGSLVKTLRADSETPNAVGDLSFLMGVPHPYSITARTTSDCTIVIMRKTAFEEVIEAYPEHMDILLSNVLEASVGLSKAGAELDAPVLINRTFGDEDDEEQAYLRSYIQKALQKRNSAALSAMTFAASDGDVETVQSLLHMGLPIDAMDYDNRTTLHLACAEGKEKVVELLVTEGADVNCKDRWGNTPLQDAIAGRHEQIVDLLSKNGAKVAYTDPSGPLCQAASDSDLDKMRTLLDNGVDPDAADYDDRCALHLAAANGNLQVVEYLIRRGANVNCRDRWSGSPLMDAITHGHDIAAKLLFANGGKMNMEAAANHLCSAASEGDISKLRLLVENGVPVDVGDYDMRCALHLAAAEGQLLAVNFLICQGARVNVRDRWGGTPLEDALRGDFLTVAVLLRKEGAELGTGDPAALEKLNIAPSVNTAKKEVIILSERMKKFGGQYVAADVESSSRIAISITALVIPRIPELRVMLFQLDEMLSPIEDEMEASIGRVEKWKRHLSVPIASKRSPAEARRKRRKKTVVIDSKRVDVDYEAKHLHHMIFTFAKHEKKLAGLLRVMESHEGESAEKWLEGALRYMSVDVEPSRISETKVSSNSIGALMASPDFRTLVQAEQRARERARKQDKGEPNIPGAHNSFIVRHTKLSGIGPPGVLTAFSDTTNALDLVFKTATGLQDPDQQGERKQGAGVLAVEDYDRISGVVERMPGLKSAHIRIAAELEHNGAISKEVLFSSFLEAWFREARLDADSDMQEEGRSSEELFRTPGMSFSEMFHEKTLGAENDEELDNNTLELIDELDEARTYRETKRRTSVMQAEIIRQAGGGDAKTKLTLGQAKGDSRSTTKRQLLEQRQASARLARCISAFGFPGMWMHAQLSRLVSVVGTLFIVWHARIRYGMQISQERLDDIFEAFRAIDIDKTGFIEACEVRELVKRIYGTTDLSAEREDVVDQLIETLDKNGDGLVSISEFISCMVGNHTQGKSVAGIFDADGFLRFASKSSRLGLPPDAPWYVLDPQSKYLKRWDTFIRLCCYYFFFDVPLRIAFQTLQELGLVYTVVTQVLDAMLLVDMIIKFFTAYVNKKSVVVIRVDKIASHYLSNGFVVDLIAAFPLDLLVYAASAKDPLYDFMAWLRIFKLLRLHRLYKYQKQRERNMNADSFFGIVSGLLPIFLGFSHLLACILYYIARLNRREGNKTWLDPYNGLGFATVLEKGDILSRYFISYYWISASVSTNGLVGDMTPANWWEIGFTCVVMLVNVTLYAYVLGEVSNAVMKQDEELVRTRQDMQAIVSFVKAKNLPENLANEIHQLSGSGDGDGAARTDGEMANLSSREGGDVFAQLSHSLQVQVARHVSRPLLRGVALFQGCSEPFLDSLSVVLKETVFPPDTFLYHVNEVARELYIVSSGSVEIVVEIEGPLGDSTEMVSDVRAKGEVVGEFSFLFGMRQQTSARSARSMNTTTYALRHSDAAVLFKLYVEQEDQLTKNVLLSMTEKDELGTPRSGTTTRTGTTQSSGTSFERSSLMSTDSSAIDNSKVVLKVLNEAKERKKNKKIVQFVTAAAAGHQDEVKRLIDSKDVEIDDGDYDKRTALHLAASNGHLDVVKLLVDLGASVNVSDRYGGKPLDDAIRHSHDMVVTFLQKNGAALNLEDAGNRLCDCAASGNIAALKRYVQSGVDPNSADYDMRTALHLAASNNRSEVVSYLVGLPSINLNSEDRWGGTPLMDSIRHMHSDVQDILRQEGANVGTIDVATQLCDVASKNNLIMLKTYGDNGVDLNSGDYDQRTALHLAASNDMLESASWMLQKEGVDSSPVDRLGGTPLDDAIRHGNSVMIALLERHHAKRGDHEEIKKKFLEQNIRIKASIAQKSRLERERVATVAPEVVLLERIEELQRTIESQITMIREDFERMRRGMRAVIESYIALEDLAEASSSWAPDEVHGELSMTEASAQQDAQFRHRSAIHSLNETLVNMRETSAKATNSIDEVNALIVPIHKLVELLGPGLQTKLENTRGAIQRLRSVIAAFQSSGEKCQYHSDVMERALRRYHEEGKKIKAGPKGKDEFPLVSSFKTPDSSIQGGNNFGLTSHGSRVSLLGSVASVNPSDPSVEDRPLDTNGPDATPTNGPDATPHNAVPRRGQSTWDFLYSPAVAKGEATAAGE